MPGGPDDAARGGFLPRVSRRDRRTDELRRWPPHGGPRGGAAARPARSADPARDPGAAASRRIRAGAAGTRRDRAARQGARARQRVPGLQWPARHRRERPESPPRGIRRGRGDRLPVPRQRGAGLRGGDRRDVGPRRGLFRLCRPRMPLPCFHAGDGVQQRGLRRCRPARRAPRGRASGRRHQSAAAAPCRDLRARAGTGPAARRLGASDPRPGSDGAELPLRPRARRDGADDPRPERVARRRPRRRELQDGEQDADLHAHAPPLAHEPSRPPRAGGGLRGRDRCPRPSRERVPETAVCLFRGEAGGDAPRGGGALHL